MEDIESMLELLKPENWGYLAGIIGLMAFLQWYVVRSAKNKNESLNLDTDAMSGEEIARAWTKGHIKSGAHKVFVVLGVTFSLIGIALVFVVLEQLLITLTFAIAAMIFLVSRLRKLRVVDLMALDEDKYQELKQYYADNRETLISDALNDPEVIQAMEKFPSWARKYNLRATKFKNFRPMRNQYD